MLLSFIRYLKGYLTIGILGSSPERFINLCRQKKIYIWGLRPYGNRYEMKMNLTDFRKLKPVIRKTKTKVFILKRHGLPFFLHKYRKRKVFFAGALLCMLLIYLCSNFIWNIHIEGNYSQTDETILEYLATQNIYHGMRKSNVNCSQIVKNIRKEFDDIIWASASIEGTRLMLHIKENTDTFSNNKVEATEDATDLISSADGFITKIITRTGTPCVEEGDPVKKNDLLVSGEIAIKNDADEIIAYKRVNADADVYIQTKLPYEDSIEISYQKKIPQKNQRKLLFFETGSIYCEFGIPFHKYKNFSVITSRKRLKLGEHFYFPLQYGIKTIQEYELQSKTRTKEEIQQILSTHFACFCDDLKKKGVEIVEKNVKIYNEGQSAKANGEIILIERAEKRRNTEIHDPKGVNNEYTRSSD